MLDEYPYRDDGKLIWQAMFDYVGAYLALYYKEDYDVPEAWLLNLALLPPFSSASLEL